MSFKLTKYLNITIPLLIILLFIEAFLFVDNSLKIVSATNKNNFSYNISVRDSINQLNQIFERAETNVLIFSDFTKQNYNINKFYDKKYNDFYILKSSALSKALLSNLAGAEGFWFQINAQLPFSQDCYNWFVKRDGKIIDFKKELERQNPPDRKINEAEDPYYFEALKQKSIIWSDIYTDKDSNVQMITVANPIYINNRLIGVVGADLSVKSLDAALGAIQQQFGGSEIFLFDKDNNLMISKHLEEERIINQHNEAVKKLIQNNTGKRLSGIEYDDNGTKRSATLLKLANKYTIILSFPQKAVFAGFTRLFGTVYIILLIVIILSIIIAFSRTKIIKINKELEKESSKIKSVIDSAPTLMAIKNTAGVYLDCNKKLLDLMNVKKEDIIGKTDYDFFNKDLAASIKEKDLEVINTKKILINEDWHKNTKGEDILLKKYRVPLLDVNQNVEGILINAIDITVQKHEQAILEKAKEAAEKANKMKSNFLANMSHEIRTPLNGIMGFLQLLEETNTTEEQKEFILDAKKSSELLLKVINEILDFSKIEAGKLQLEQTAFDLRSLVEDITTMSSSNAQTKNIEINSLIYSDVPQYLIGDSSRIKQILNNLIGNAIKFTTDGEVFLTVAKESETQDYSIISFKIKDTGIGIPKEKLELIFGTFTQADDSTTRRYGGTGLGLAISDKLAKLMSGQITVESIEGQGSTFTLTVPFMKNGKNNFEDKQIQNNIKGENILIISPFNTSFEVLKYYLNESGCNIFEAPDKENALNIIEQKDSISLIIVDNSIQDFNLKNTNKNIPILLYAPLSQKDVSLITKEKEFSGYISKPVRKNEIIEKIGFLISNKEKKSEEKLSPQKTEIKFNHKAEILLVEDCEINSKLIVKILNNVGLNCDIAANGQEAVESFKNKKYDIIFMDCQMPIIDGYEATTIIRDLEKETKNNTHTPIIALTANVFKSDIEKCKNVGMDDYISKPININNLIEVLNKYTFGKNKDYQDTLTDNQLAENNNSSTKQIISEMMANLDFTEEEALDIFKNYIELVPNAIAAMENFLEQNDFEGLKKTAHKLKGASANLRIHKIAEVCNEIENVSDYNKDFFIDKVTQIKNDFECLKILKVE